MEGLAEGWKEEGGGELEARGLLGGSSECRRRNARTRGGGMQAASRVYSLIRNLGGLSATENGFHY